MPILHGQLSSLNQLLITCLTTKRLSYLLITQIVLFLLINSSLIVNAKAAQEDSKKQTVPAIQLPTQYRENIKVNEYYVSEKLDGIRAYWDGHKLLSKQGNIFTAPDWFVAHFPTQAVDGELWIARQTFEQVSSIVRTRDSQNPDWQLVRFMIFDLPTSQYPFGERVAAMQKLVTTTDSAYFKLIPQQKIKDNAALFNLLDKVVNEGGEGLMLHHQDALYQHIRSRDLMKLKRFEDAEATVIGYLPGKGKYQGLLGALQVETEDGIRFKIGTGFSDKERKNPPPIGSVITYRYTGKTRHNIPRFASFMRIRAVY
ncbi:DNA ligase [Psychromonas sp. 14N.309.X.WAT.B.A12]|uniref:DNA ligase n=1 Tax=Psychromonas sp. 14N.309.X.WAT.B.A12 TaxID=2998322 RepID=UPI0025AF96DD|nr:DNA ligase [Psychromonas sp. 14N.309.X.WAT.B.A12]MDN2663655.1 DNA ligase [Psychromonas sp. 14N.309.X.WAT.B.A12]